VGRTHRRSGLSHRHFLGDSLAVRLIPGAITPVICDNMAYLEDREAPSGRLADPALSLAPMIAKQEDTACR
jgi:hypothetical protein